MAVYREAVARNKNARCEVEMKNMLSQPSSLSSLQDECLKTLVDVFDVPRAASYMVDRRSRMFGLKHHGVQAGMQRDYIDHFQHHDPLHPHHVRRHADRVLRSSEAVSLKKRQENPYYADFFKRWGILETVEVYLHVGGRIAAGMTLFMGPHRGSLSSADMKKVERLQGFMQFSLEACLEAPRQRDLGDICDEFHLTPRERLVVELVLQGLPNKRMATDLCCSLSTIKTHLQHISEKMQVNGKAEIASLLYSQQRCH
ncbi:hypothetical protein CVH10_05700 [Halomonas sp. ND22Bw]|uniref:helix-turn-helix transcriptional regulator n=1 Tax=Halomonas sp. ND22Bw TaxID=2054178 RepID=UPI000D0B8935|nr:hypothetical protein CVH10_05700 [Halomonas sp. ND22Bw]